VTKSIAISLKSSTLFLIVFTSNYFNKSGGLRYCSTRSSIPGYGILTSDKPAAVTENTINNLVWSVTGIDNPLRMLCLSNYLV